MAPVIVRRSLATMILLASACVSAPPRDYVSRDGLPNEPGATERIEFVGGHAPRRTGGEKVSITYEPPSVCHTLILNSSGLVVSRDCFPVCRADRHVYLLREGRQYPLGRLSDRGELTVDPAAVSTNPAGLSNVYFDLATASHVDIAGCPGNPNEWQARKTPEDTLRLMRSRQKTFEEDPQKLKETWEELLRRHNKPSWYK